MLEIRETYVNATEDTRFGDSGWMPAMESTWGEVFRSARSEYGRCTGKVYQDVRVQLSNAVVAFGHVIPPRYRYDVVHVGWTFAKRMLYQDARPDRDTGRFRDSDYYLREVWVRVREAS